MTTDKTDKCKHKLRILDKEVIWWKENWDEVMVVIYQEERK
jgi:hypothetical protein